MSSEFLFLLYFFLVNAFFLNFYLGILDLQLNDLHHLSAEDIHDYGRLFTLIITLGVVLIPVVGAIMDTLGYPATSFFTIAAGVLWSLLLQLSPQRTPWALVTSFILYATYRTFFYSYFFAYVSDVFGFKYFGLLAGIVFVIAGVLSLAQYPLVTLGSGTCSESRWTTSAPCEGSYWRELDAVMTLLIASTWVFTYRDWSRRLQQTRIQEQIKVHEEEQMRILQQHELVPLVVSKENPTGLLKSALRNSSQLRQEQTGDGGSYGSV